MKLTEFFHSGIRNKIKNNTLGRTRNLDKKVKRNHKWSQQTVRRTETNKRKQTPTRQTDKQTSLLKRSPTTWRSRNTTQRILTKPKNTPRPPRWYSGMETTPSRDIQTKQRPRTRKKMKSYKQTLKKRLHYIEKIDMCALIIL